MDDCFFKNFQCYLCGKLGYLKRACKSRTKSDQSKPVTRQNQEQGLKTLAHEISVTSNDCFNLYSFMNSNKPLCIALNVKNSPVRIELVTGSALSIISYEEFSKNLKTCLCKVLTYFRRSIPLKKFHLWECVKSLFRTSLLI